VRAAERRVSKAIAAGIAFILAGGTIHILKGEDGTTKPSPGKNAAIIQNARRVQEVKSVVTHYVRNIIISEIRLTKQFPYDISDQVINEAPDIRDWFPKLHAALLKASQNNNYKKCVDLIKETGLTISAQVYGYASPEGKEGYNLRLSEARAMTIKEKLGAFGQHYGIPITVEKVEGMGERGEKQLLEKVRQLLTNPKSGGPIVEALARNMSERSRKTLEFWWKRVIKPRGGTPKRKDKSRKKALENILYMARKVKELDALLLAPHRKVVVQLTLRYIKEGTAPETVAHLITVEPHPEISPLPDRIWSEKAILPTLPGYTFLQTEEPVTVNTGGYLHTPSIKVRGGRGEKHTQAKFREGRKRPHLPKRVRIS
jgi:hypothetical protein